jgi:hypothetical protein
LVKRRCLRRYAPQRSQAAGATKNLVIFAASTALVVASLSWGSTSTQIEELAPLVVPRTTHTATVLSDGRVLITGGRDSAGTPLAAAEIFDPATQTSTAIGELLIARTGHTATLLSDGRVLVAGGTNAIGPLTSAEIFDPSALEAGFRLLPANMGTARTRHTATLLNSGKVLIAGGDDAGTAEIFDPATESFSSALLLMADPRSGHTATLLPNDSVLLAGGQTDSMEFFNATDETFTLDPHKMSSIRTGQEAIGLSDTRVLFFGGDTTNTIEEFNLSTDTLTLKATMDAAASTATLLANDKILVLRSDMARIYDPDASDQLSPDASNQLSPNRATSRHVSKSASHSRRKKHHPKKSVTRSVRRTMTKSAMASTSAFTGTASNFTAFDEISVPGVTTLQRSGQTATEIGDGKKILVAGGVNAQNQFVAPVALFNPARSWTDKDDYQPDDPVVLSGSGWKANEGVYLFAVDSETDQWTYETTVTADANGEFSVSPYFIVQLRHQGVTFDATAMGAVSTMIAKVSFTDTTSQVTKIAFDRTGPAAFTVNTANGVLGVQLRNASNNPEALTGNANSTVTITITSNSGSGRFDTTSGGSFTLTSLVQTITSSSASPLNPNFPDFYYKDTATGSVTLTATVTAKGSNLANLVGAGLVTTLQKQLAPATSLAVNPASGTYGGTVNLSATLSGGSSVSGKTINFTLSGNPVGIGTTNGSGVATLNNASLAGINAAANPYPTGVGASFAGDSSNPASSGTASLTVGKADATVNVTPYHVGYDGNPHTATGTATGVNGENLNALLNLTGTTHTNFGDYPADPWTFAGNTNYNAKNDTVHDIIDTATATVTLSQLNQPYNAQPRTVNVKTTPNNLSVSVTYEGSPTAPTNVGSYAVVATVTDPNYTGSASGTLVIGKANAAITVTPYHVFYDNNPHTATVIATGIGGVDLSASVNLSGTTHTAAADYPTDAWTFSNPNYNDQNGTVHDIIDAATATIVVTPYHVPYDGNPHTATVTATGVDGVDLSASVNLSGTTHTNAGTYNGDAWSFSSPNYASQNGTVDDKIDKVNATINVTPYDVPYDGDPHTATGTATGVKSESLSGLDLSHTTHTNAGTYSTDYWKFTDSTGNYNNVGNTTITDKIDKVNATIVVNGYTGTYDGFAHGATGSATGVKGANLSGQLNLGATFTNYPGGYANWTFSGGTNYNDDSGSVAIVISKANAMIVITAYSVVSYDSMSHTATGTAKGVLNEDLSAGLDLSGTTHTNAGDYPTDPWTFTGGTNYNDDAGTVHDSIGKANLTITADSFTKQYSDPMPTFTVKYVGFVGNPPETSAVLDGTLMFTTSPAANQFSGPGAYAIIPSGLTSGNYTIKYCNGALTVTQEDARATYAGAMFVSTSSATSSTATVTLSATVQDIIAVTGDPAYDAYPGDIRNAKVSFINRDTNTVIVSNLPVGLVSSGDTKTGAATYNWSVNIGTNDSQQYTIGIIVSGYYTRNASTDDAVVTVSKAIPGMITGGGYLVMQSPAGLYPGGVGTKNNFGFNVKNASNGPKGNINTIIRNNGRVYQIKGNAMTSLVTKLATVPSATTPSTATFNGKANIQDITNPLAPISIDGNATLQVQMNDAGEPGANDTIAITVWNKLGGVWFSSNWSGTKTVAQKLGGGNLVVR